MMLSPVRWVVVDAYATFSTALAWLSTTWR